MALPLILLAGSAIGGLGGITAGIKGIFDFKDANEKLERAKEVNAYNMEVFEKQNKKTMIAMDSLGEKEISILSDFSKFIDIFEKIKNKPNFEDIAIEKLKIPQFKKDKIKEVSIGANILLGGLGGAALGTAGGFAASGATTAAVVVLAKASTGVAISSLSGVAATNATLAVLGGGTLAAGGGGVALGTTVLGAATLGVGLLVGGVIFSLAGSSVSDKADEAWEQVAKNGREMEKIGKHLIELSEYATNFLNTLSKVEKLYIKELARLDATVNILERLNYEEYSETEKRNLENTVNLVAVLYNMCKVKFTENTEGKEINKINRDEINRAIRESNDYLESQIA